LRQTRANKSTPDVPPNLPQPEAVSSEPKKRTVFGSALGVLKRRRTPWLVMIACLIGLCAYFTSKMKDQGIIEYSSDDPNAQVILEKDGQDFVLKQGTKYSMQLAPGHYTVRLAGNAEGLKLQPAHEINLDPRGKAIINVRKK
jgi:hypothetical protein